MLKNMNCMSVVWHCVSFLSLFNDDLNLIGYVASSEWKNDCEQFIGKNVDVTVNYLWYCLPEEN